MYGGTVKLRGQVLFDDGVVLYLNGSELGRFNMPTGTITAATQARSGHESTDSVPTFEMVVTNWNAGNNVLAAEVHQNGPASGDIVFGLELTVTSAFELLSSTNLPVHITRVPLPGRYAAEWFGGGWLESADSIAGPWNAITPVSPYF